MLDGVEAASDHPQTSRVQADVSLKEKRREVAGAGGGALSPGMVATSDSQQPRAMSLPPVPPAGIPAVRQPRPRLAGAAAQGGASEANGAQANGVSLSAGGGVGDVCASPPWLTGAPCAYADGAAPQAKTEVLRSVPSRVVAWAASHGDAVAVRCPAPDNDAFSYAELVRDAWGLADELTRLGLGAGGHVALLVGRSYDTIVALLGTWLAGSVYIAVDLAYPASRIEYILDDSGAQALVTSVRTGSELITEDWQHPVVRLCRGKLLATEGGVRSEPIQGPRPAPQISPDDLACIFYTSGTSGKPKGVPIDHGAFSLAVSNIPSLPGFGPGDVFGQVSSACYPGHVADVWRPLSLGACLLMVAGTTLLDTSAMHKLVEAESIAGMILTPKVLELYADAPPPAPTALAGLRLIQFAGERVRVDAVIKLLRAAQPGTVFQHLYGCSEHCSIISGLHITAGPGAADALEAATSDFKRLPVGHAVAGVHISVRDPDSLELVEEGEVGEVFVSSRQVARGYLDRPEETEERFVTLPGLPGRAYRTGDLGRVAPHGLGLDLLGRAKGDGMVKIHGHRVELGEIEAAALELAPEEQQAHVTVWRSHLVLYLAPGLVDPDELKAMLRGTLPAWMVPTYVECLPFLPLNVAGKVDGASLPPPEAVVEATAMRSVSFKSGGGAKSMRGSRSSLVTPRASFRTASPGHSATALVRPGSHMSGGSSSAADAAAAASVAAQLSRGWPTAGADSLEAASESEAVIIELFANALDVPARVVSAVSSFTQLGGHSLSMMSLLAALRKEFDTPELQLADVLEDDCPRHVSSIIHAYASLRDASAAPGRTGSAALPSPQGWLIAASPSTRAVLPADVQCINMGEPGATPVWVVPGGQGRPRVGIAVGRAMRRRPCFTLEITAAAAEAAASHPTAPLDGLLDYWLRTITAVQPRGPYVIAGNRLAFSVGVALEARGEAVEAVVILDDNPLWFDREAVERAATCREHYAWIGMFKYAVLARVFLPGAGAFADAAQADPEYEEHVAAMEAELDTFEARYHEVMAAGGNPAKLLVEHVSGWLGQEEAARWAIGLATLMPILLSKARPPARLGTDVLSAPIVVLKAKDSWTHSRIQQLYDPEGAHNYSWGPFTSAGAPRVHDVNGTHFSMGYDPAGAREVGELMDSL